MTGKSLKFIIGAVGTLALVACPVLYTTALQSVTTDPKTQELSGTSKSLPSPANAVEPLASTSGNALQTSTSQPVPEASAQSAQGTGEIWPPGQETAASPRPEVLTGEDRIRFQRMMQVAEARSLYQRPIGEIVQAIASQLVGSGYQANLLDQSTQERLVVSLTRFDCVLFVETVLALARGIAQQDYTYQTFTQSLQSLRYRDGSMVGYCSRLHYFSEWISDNQRRGNVQNISLHLGGISLHKMLNFMSGNRQSYARLNDARTYQCVRQMESAINPFVMNYIPASQIRQNYGRLQSGDIVAIATDIPGLDVTHTGLVYRNQDGGLGLIHATPGRGVAISPDLQRYVSHVDSAIGVLLVRPVDPRQQTSLSN